MAQSGLLTLDDRWRAGDGTYFRNRTAAGTAGGRRGGDPAPPRAVELVSGWALGELGLDQLLLEADEGNAASIRVAEKCTFTRIGTRLDDNGNTKLVFARTPPRG